MTGNKEIKVIELRNYLIKPGLRDQFIAYFKEHFIGSQVVLEGYPLGEFTIKGKQDRFFWIRGFSDMDTRSKFLPAFYGGGVWKQYGPAANEMMLEWHHVHLLKPLKHMVSSNEFERTNTFLTVDYYPAKDGQLDKLIDIFQTEYIPFLKASGIENVSLWITEPRENDFPRLPVIQNKSMLVALTYFKDEAEYELKLDQIHFNSFGSRSHLQECIAGKETLLLHADIATITKKEDGKF